MALPVMWRKPDKKMSKNYGMKRGHEAAVGGQKTARNRSSWRTSSRKQLAPVIAGGPMAEPDFCTAGIVQQTGRVYYFDVAPDRDGILIFSI